MSHDNIFILSDLNIKNHADICSWVFNFPTYGFVITMVSLILKQVKRHVIKWCNQRGFVIQNLKCLTTENRFNCMLFLIFYYILNMLINLILINSSLL